MNFVKELGCDFVFDYHNSNEEMLKIVRE